MKGQPLRRITAAHWAANRRNETEVLFEFLKRETEAETRERGHECGHQFTITVTSRGHYGLAGVGGAEDPAGGSYMCEDADYESEVPMTLTVRAHDLQAALLKAASHGLADWKWEGRDDDGD
jgi:hypothetical protein